MAKLRRIARCKLLIGAMLMGVLCAGCGQHNAKFSRGDAILGGADAPTATILQPKIRYAPVMVHNVDYEEYFQGIGGGAVFYRADTRQWDIYGAQACDTRVSPCSTFKIVSTLIGLETDVITSQESKLGYDNTVYSRETWNADVTLKEAFKASCVWYFRKIVDLAGKTQTQTLLTQLGYGNCDASEWEGGDLNPTPELNGFWIESSLKISPKEQVQVLLQIFGAQSEFSKEHRAILKDIMFIDTIDGISLYGKTGTGRNQGWFVGFFEKNDAVSYFAAHVASENRTARGKNAQEIAQNIIRTQYAL